jgi:hypothetical protein
MLAESKRAWAKSYGTPANDGKRFVYIAALALKKVLGKPYKEEKIQAPDQFKGQAWQYLGFDTERGMHEIKLVWKPRKSVLKGHSTWGMWMELYDGENQYEIDSAADIKKALAQWGLNKRK